MSILIPTSPTSPVSPKRIQKLPSAPLSPKQNVLKKEMELNLAESAVLRNSNSQLEIETNTLRKQLKYLKKSIQFETNQRSQLLAEEEKKLEKKLLDLEEDFKNQVDDVSKERKQKRNDQLDPISNQIKELSDIKSNLQTTVSESSKQIKEFMALAHQQIIDQINSEKKNL